MAEREGFEPSVQLTPDNCLAGSPVRPLQHLPTRTSGDAHCTSVTERPNPTFTKDVNLTTVDYNGQLIYTLEIDNHVESPVVNLNGSLTKRCPTQCKKAQMWCLTSETGTCSQWPTRAWHNSQTIYWSIEQTALSHAAVIVPTFDMTLAV